jgi:hypothetical protein
LWEYEVSVFAVPSSAEIDMGRELPLYLWPQVITLPCNNPTTSPKPSSSPSPTPDSPDACTYTIKAGDTLGAIASAHQTTVEAITALNPGILPTNLQIGQVGWSSGLGKLLPGRARKEFAGTVSDQYIETAAGDHPALQQPHHTSQTLLVT